jgi:hypothetical protein
MIYLKNIVNESKHVSNIKKEYDQFQNKFSSYLDRLIYFLDSRKFFSLTGIKSNTWNHSHGHVYDFLEDNIDSLKVLSANEFDNLFNDINFLLTPINFFWFYNDGILDDKVIGDRDKNVENKEDVELFFMYMLIDNALGDRKPNIKINFNTDVISKENQQLKSFYNEYFKESFERILLNLNSVWHQHGMHMNSFKKFIKTDMKTYPQFTNWKDENLCVESDTFLNNSNIFGIETVDDDTAGYKGTSYYRTIAGIILDSDIREVSDTINCDRDHLVFDNIKIPSDKWIFLHNSNNGFLDKYYIDLFDNDIIPLDKNILYKIILLNNLLSSKLKMYFVA